MEYQILKIQIADRIAVATISRPAAMNALNTAFFNELNHLLDDLEPILATPLHEQPAIEVEEPAIEVEEPAIEVE